MFLSFIVYNNISFINIVIYKFLINLINNHSNRMELTLFTGCILLYK